MTECDAVILIEVGRTHFTLMHNLNSTLLTNHKQIHIHIDMLHIGAFTEERSHIKASQGRLVKYCYLCPQDKFLSILRASISK